MFEFENFIPLDMCSVSLGIHTKNQRLERLCTMLVPNNYALAPAAAGP